MITTKTSHDETGSAIRLLPDYLINQIAAGEVVERPSAVVKELVENSLDAGADTIDVEIRDGGKSFICVKDNGHGMMAEELRMSLDRHTTSKLQNDDLLNIKTMGFRGEALASIASVARVSIHTRKAGSYEAWEIRCENGAKQDLRPSAVIEGTKVEVRDLFHSIPARLKFLKSGKAEAMSAKSMIARLALANPGVAFRLTHDGKTIWNLVRGRQEDPYISLKTRIAGTLGEEFVENSIQVNETRDNKTLSGYISLPVYHRPTAQNQYLFVNGRAVTDKLLLSALRGAYADVLPYGRFPSVVLFLSLPFEDLDVNVHPAKTEVRFKTPADIRNFIVSTLKHSLYNSGVVPAPALADKALGYFGSGNAGPGGFKGTNKPGDYKQFNPYPPTYMSERNHEKSHGFFEPLPQVKSSEGHDYEETDGEENAGPGFQSFPLGAACAQIHGNYIIAQTEDGIILVDQHAAHERIVYEDMKRQREAHGIAKQGLLTPEIITFKEEKISVLLENRENLDKFGLEIDSFGKDAIAVNAVPALLLNDNIDWSRLLEDLADVFLDGGTHNLVEEAVNHRLATAACHGSVRSGRKLNVPEMNVLLRKMEETPLSGQCNHGRPTYIALKLKEVDKLFGRS